MPGSIVDVFRSDAFSLVSLTDAINKAPYKPGRIGALGLFRESGMTTIDAAIEEKDGQLELIESSPRGGPASQLVANKRRARIFRAIHLERDSTIYADAIQGVRAFGSESEVQALQPIVDDRLATLRAMHEVTLEWLRFGAIKGLILDADGTTVLYNLFTEFGVSQQTYTMSLLASAAVLRAQAVAIQRLIEDELGNEVVSGYRAFCGDDFFDTLIDHPNVSANLVNQESAQLRQDLRRTGFEYGGIKWENYRGRVSGNDFVETDEAYVVPEGTANVFRTYFAPADMLETVNTVGLPMYAKTVFDPELNRWVKIHSQSNPLPLLQRPRAVVKVTMGT